MGDPKPGRPDPKLGLDSLSNRRAPRAIIYVARTIGQCQRLVCYDDKLVGHIVKSESWFYGSKRNHNRPCGKIEAKRPQRVRLALAPSLPGGPHRHDFRANVIAPSIAERGIDCFGCKSSIRASMDHCQALMLAECGPSDGRFAAVRKVESDSRKVAIHPLLATGILRSIRWRQVMIGDSHKRRANQR